MAKFEGISTVELQAELVKREQEAKETATPKPLKNIDFGPVIKLCQEYIDDISKTGVVDENYDQWFFEETMRVVFGPNIWDWVNEHGYSD